MSQQQSSSSNQADHGDGSADAFATIAIIALIVTAVAYWLHGMPT